MIPAPKLTQFIEQLAQKHQFDWRPTGAYLRLDLDAGASGARLIIENIGASRLSIAYQLYLFGEWIADPEIVLWTAYAPKGNPEEEKPPRGWVPIELYEIQRDWKACADIDPHGNLVGFRRHEWQAWLAEFTETVVVPNLLSQGWLARGVKSDAPPPTYTQEQMQARGYLIEYKIYRNDEEDMNDVPF